MCEFLELGIINVCPVHGHYIAIVKTGGLEHEGIIGCSRSKPDGRGHALVGVNDRMNFDSSFLAACLRMSAHYIEDKVGKQGYGRGVYYLETFHPFRGLPRAAVRGKYLSVGAIQMPVYALEYSLWTPLVGICERALGDFYAL